MKSMSICFLSAISFFVCTCQKTRNSVSVDRTSTHSYCLNLYSTFLFSSLSFSQWCFNNDRPFLGHQPRPARLLHPLLASEPRWRLFSTERGEPRHRGHDAHRLSAQVSHACERGTATHFFLTATHFIKPLLGLPDRSTSAAALRSNAAVAIVTRSPQSS